MTYVPVPSEMLKQLYLSQRTLRQDLLAKDIGDLLDRNALLGLRVGCSTVINLLADITNDDREEGSQAYQTIP
jgi:hypothetical protein